MNPNDPNQPTDQPQDQAPQVPQYPEAPVENTAPVAPAEQPVVAPAPAPTPVEQPVAANPFGAAPESVQPVAPQPTPFGTAPEPVAGVAPTPKKSNKKVGIIAGIVGGVVVLGAIIVGVLLSLTTVSAADYKSAYDQLVIVRNAASSTNTNVGADAEEKLEKSKELIATYKAENAKLANLKAFKGDEELKSLYATYNTKAAAYISYAEGLLPSIEAMSKAQADIKALGTGSALLSSANVEKTIAIYEELSSVSDPSIKAFAEAGATAYKEVLPQAKILESAGSSTSEKLAASRAISASVRTFSSASSTMSTALSDKNKEISIVDSLKALGDATTKKYNDKR